MNFMSILAGALTSVEGVLGTPAALWDASTTNTLHIYSYTLEPAATGLVVIAYADSGQTFTLCEWNPVGSSPVAMTALTARSNGNTRCQMFHLLNPIPGTGAGSVRLSASLAGAMGIVPISIKGWVGTAPIETGQAAATGSPPGLTLASVVPGSLVIHGLCAGTFDVTMTFTGVGETELVNVSQSNLRMGASQLVSAAGGSVVVDSTLSPTTGRYADVAAAFPFSFPAPKTYYVDSTATGNDSANGLSPSTPWQTIAKVNGSTFLPGDHILFAGGQTFTGTLSFTSSSWPSATPSAPVTIGSYGTGRATISSGAANGFINWNTSGFHLRDLHFLGNGTGDVTGVYNNYEAAGAGKLQYLRFTNLDITGYGKHGLEVHGGYGGPLFDSTTGFNDVVIDGVVAYGNCNIHLGGGGEPTAGIRVHGFNGFNGPGTSPTHTNVTIRNCIAHSNLGVAGAAHWTGSGIVVAATRTALIEHCVAYNNGQNSTTPDGPVGIFIHDSDLVTIQYCESYNNTSNSNPQTDGGGFDLDVGMTNSVIQYCYSHGNAGPGFMMYNQTGAITPTWANNTIRYCISQNDAVGRSAWGSGGITISKSNATMTNPRVYNNTIYTNSAVATTCYIGMDGTGTISGGLVANNIFYSSAGAWLVNTEIYNPTGVAFKGNDYYAAGTFRIGWNSVTYSGVAATQFANWKTAAGQETAPGAGLLSNPLLTTPGGGGTLNGYVVGQPAAYKLQSGSPMIGAGLNMSTQLSINPGTTDFFGTTIPVGGTFEIGAHEFV